jgi:hypothetical protein
LSAIAFVVGIVLQLIIGAVGPAIRRGVEVATSAAARTRTVDFADAFDHAAFCRGKGYLINVRGADVPEHVREQRRHVIANCPEHARLQ